MFIGAIKAEIRRFLATHGKMFNDRDIYIGCSGNFTIEQTLTRYAKPKSINSNDVSLYTCTLAAFFMGSRLPMRIKNEEYKFLQPLLDSNKQAAAIINLTALGAFAKSKNAYARRMFNGYRRQLLKNIETTHNRLKEIRPHIRIDSFFQGDVRDFIDNIPDEAVIIASPPTYKGGYEKIYDFLESIVEWDKPDYAIMDEDGYCELFSKIKKRGNYIFISDREIDEEIAAKCDYRGFKTIYVFSDLNPKTYVNKDKLNEQIVKYPLINYHDKITRHSQLKIHKTTANIFNHYRFMFIKGVKKVSNAGVPFLITLDGKLIGCIAVDIIAYGTSSRHMLYLNSDFAVPYSRYKRLSKLIVMVSLSTEIKEFMEREKLQEFTTLRTTAFTNKPVSMKYRGPFKLEKRQEGQLNYIAPLGCQGPLKKVLKTWLQKHSQYQR